MKTSKHVFKRLFTILPALAMVSLFFLSAAPAAFGRPFRIDRVPDKGRRYGCALCHLSPRGGGRRNAFGNDYARIAVSAGDTYTPALGKIDSDGDGAGNDQEFAAGTHPGDPDSRP